jgi:hypothetical protein
MTLAKKGIVFLLVIVVSLLVLSGFVKAIEGRMGNAKMILYPEVDGKNDVVIEKSISVRNVNNETINISLVADEDAAKFIKIIDTNFLLEPRAQKDAQFEVRVKKEAIYQGNINVFFKPLDPNKNGIVLTSQITVVAKKNQDYQDTNDNTDNTDTNQTTNPGDNPGKDGTGGNGNPGILFLVITSALLIVLLIALIVILNKRKTKKRNGGKK